MAQLERCGCGKVCREADGCLSCQKLDEGTIFPRISDVLLCGSSASGLEIEVPGLPGRQCLPWSLLQPVPKPIIEVGMAKVKWRFHCINLDDQPSDFCSGPENHWEVEWNSRTSASASNWRTGHLDVRVSLRDGGTFQVQEMPSTQSLGCPQLLCLGHRVHLCLEHRDQPLKAFRRPCAPEMRWPVHVTSWLSAAEYAAAWRHLSFMEAVSTAVSESDGRILDGVSIRFFESNCGTFEIPLDLSEAHQLRIRADDLLCLRWPLEASDRRQQLIEDAFRAMGGELERLGCLELRKLAKFTGFDGSDDEWSLEFQSLCRDFGTEDGLDLEAFSKLVDEQSEQGCYCSDAELQELRQLYGVRSGLVDETWVAHALVESAEKFGDTWQVRFQICEVPGLKFRLPDRLCSSEPVPGFIVELLWLPETYHYQAAALADIEQSASLVQDLVLFGGVRQSNEAMENLREPCQYQLNDSQSEAVRSALTSPVTLIHGPPGTGKTRTAAVVALTFASQNAQSSARGCVLYAANSNRAVDVAAEAITELSTERLEDLFEHQDQDEKCAICWQEGCNAITFCGHVFHRHCLTQALRASVGGRSCPICRAALKSIEGIRLLRVYSSDTENLEFPIPRPYRYDGVRERRRFSVPEEMRRFALHWRIHNKVASHFNPRAAACEAAYEKLLSCSPQSNDLDAARTSYLEVRREARAFELQSCNILLATNCSCRRGWIPQMLQKENIELRQVIVDECGTSPEPESLCPLTLSRTVQRVVLVGDHRQLRPVVKNRDAGNLGLACSLFERLSTKATFEAGSAIAIPEAAKNSEILKPMQPQDSSDRGLLAYQAFQSLCGGKGCLGSEEMLIFAKLTGFEGSAADWQEEFQSLCQELGAQGIDLATFSRLVDDASEQGCFCTDEELRNIIRSGTTTSSQPECVMQAPKSVLLRQQYRMHPSMNSFPSKQFYDGKVFSDKSTKDRPAGLLAHGSGARCPVLFWSSPSTFQEEVHEVATRDASTRSKANVKEAHRCARLAAEIAQCAGAKSVAVLSWYNAQVVELKSCLRKQNTSGIHVGSVVTAQGSEWDYVLLSTVLSSKASLQEAKLGCLADKHLLNVAVSRARVGLVVLGCPDVLQGNRHWAAFLEHCKDLGGMVQDGDEPSLSAEGPLSDSAAERRFQATFERAIRAYQQFRSPQEFYPPPQRKETPSSVTRDFCRIREVEGGSERPEAFKYQ